ncbi:hypothetical protein [Halobiforma nitratireducens]|uniref:Uncharacterized protein n=1 Tax=Halobiforma nitratireducens JCM 10879 TaxID=1227454 RepID=M0MLE4_9EURY|nr:hypothetical protein [Halobiforma nitratireducens]EMA45539.1 hypothetical protein C446_02180 [Halobiforma nitratireducens JCM 10879]
MVSDSASDSDSDSDPDPPPPLSRRRLLGGLAAGLGLGGGAVVVTGATRPTLLPNVLADWATNYYPTPPRTQSLWQPTVTDAHASDAVDRLVAVEDEALERWDEIDPDEHRLRGSGGWLSSAEESLADGDYAAALSRSRTGLRFAGESLGEANARVGEDDLEPVVDRAADVLTRVDAVLDDLESYPVADPVRDLGWYAEIESDLRTARRLARFSGFEDLRDERTGDGTLDGTVSDRPEYDPRDVGEITAALLQAELLVETAEHYRAHLRDNLADEGGGDPFHDHLRDLVGTFGDELDGVPTRNEIESAVVDDTGSYGPYEFARMRLAGWALPRSFELPDDTAPEAEFLVREVLDLSRTLVDWRAHERATDALAVDPDDDGFDPGHVLAEQRRGRSAYRDVIGSDPSPFLVVLSEPGVGNLRVADVDRDWDDRWTPWHERIQSYLNALLGRSRLQEYPAVYGTIVEN